MTSIPLTIEGLKEQYEQLVIVEANRREELNQLRRAVFKASRDRKAAYRMWQDKLKRAAQ